MSPHVLSPLLAQTAGGGAASPGTRPGGLLGWLHSLLGLPEQASTIASRIDGLQYVQFGVLVGLSLVMCGLALFFVIRYRRRDDGGATPEVRAPVWLELGVAGSLFVVFAIWWVVGFRDYLRVGTPPDDAVQVYVTGKQWVWTFDYAEGPSSAGVLYVPRGRPVHLLLTSRDVIHSFFVPAFRLKRDAVPGRYTELWFEAEAAGRYPAYCAEFCGGGHSRMWADVVVLAPEAFERWLEGEAPDTTGAAVGEAPIRGPTEGASDRGRSMAEEGRRVAAGHGCLECHSTDGTASTGPTWLGLFGSEEVLASGDTVVVDAAYVTRSMMDPMAQVVAGYPAVMPTFQGQVEPGEVAAIVEFIRSLRYAEPRVREQGAAAGDGGSRPEGGGAP